MSDLILTKTQVQSGIYEGVLTATTDTDPKLTTYHMEQPVGDLEIAEDPNSPNTWSVKVSLPIEALTDGIQTFLIVDTKTGETLDSLSIITGEPLGEDLRAEIDLLRAELDMLKKAFRRHCVETTS